MLGGGRGEGEGGGGGWIGCSTVMMMIWAKGAATVLLYGARGYSTVCGKIVRRVSVM